MFNEEVEYIPLAPVNYFQLAFDCYKCEFNSKKDLPSKCFLPSTSPLCDEYNFAKVGLAWSNEGITVQVKVNQKFERVEYPNVSHGDCIELFFDTRDVKTSGFNTRFCHHFFFLPESIDGHQAGEITHFRTEDRHDLCDPSLLKVVRIDPFLIKNSYTLKIFVPSQCLHGYDPEQFDRLGFAYRINRAHGEPQHLSAVTREYNIAQQPSLWSSVKLVHENGSLR